MFLPTILLLLLLSWCFHFLWKRRRLYRLSQNVPGPFHLPIIPTGYLLLKEDISKTHKWALKAFDKYPKLFKTWLGPYLYYCISKPEYAKIMLNSPAAMEKIGLMEYMKPFLGDGLITSPDVWKRHRKIIAPSMSRNILNNNPKIISEHCLVLMEKLEELCGKGEINICKYITNCMMDTIGDTLCGFQINAEKDNKKYSACRNKVKNIALQISENSKIDSNKPFLNLQRKKIEINQYSENEMESEIYTFLMAGTDTTAVTICMILTLLALHQDIQQKLYEEVMKVVGSDGIIELESLQKLEYTKRVIKETLRLFPTVPFIGRTLKDDLVLDGTIIPKGANLVLSVFHMHRSNKYWKEPLKFDPDRFLPGNLKNNHPYQWLPFSGGPRNCIGIKQAEMTMSIMTAMIIRKLKINTSLKSLDDMELRTDIVSKPINGFKVALELRLN